MSKLTMKLTEPNGEPVYIAKSAVMRWKKGEDIKGSTKITLMDGSFQIVTESPDQVNQTMTRG